jgi:hypothetical protein
MGSAARRGQSRTSARSSAIVGGASRPLRLTHGSDDRKVDPRRRLPRIDLSTVFEPWLAIPAEDYYRYNLLLNVPSVLLAWVAATGFTHLAARALGGKGTFETTLGVLGLGIGVASWVTGLHDLLTSCLGYLRLLDQRAYEDAMSAPGTGAHRLI